MKVIDEHSYNPPEVPPDLPLDEVKDTFTRRDFEQIEALLLYESRIPGKLTDFVSQYSNWKSCTYSDPSLGPKFSVDRVLEVLGHLASGKGTISGATAFEKKVAFNTNLCSEYSAYINVLIRPQFDEMMVDESNMFSHWYQAEVADPFSEVALLIRQWIVSHILFASGCNCFFFDVNAI